MLSISIGTPEIGLRSHPNNLCGSPNKAVVDRHKKRGAADRGYQGRLMGSERWDCNLKGFDQSVNTLAADCILN